MQKIKIIAISCIAYMGIGFAALHTPDAELSATTYTNYYYRFWELRIQLLPGGGYTTVWQATSHVAATTGSNPFSCLNGYTPTKFGIPVAGEWRFERNEIEPIAWACLP